MQVWQWLVGLFLAAGGWSDFSPLKSRRAGSRPVLLMRTDGGGGGEGRETEKNELTVHVHTSRPLPP